MKTRFFPLLAFGLAIWTACSPVPSAVRPPREHPAISIPEKTFLPQDREALQRAQEGWWTRSMENYLDRMVWFDEARFGCFIHWGVYSVPAGFWKGREVTGYSEHLMRKERIPLQEYRESLVKTFNPVDFQADEWMQHVSDAGMKYFIITSKHHDGFAMFPSEAYPYDIRLTGYAGDPMMELREAARKRGIKFGFYYSHAFDWEHPDAPGNDWEYDHPGGDKKLGGTNWWESEEFRPYLAHAEKYVKEKSIPQIQELIRNYRPDILWFDTPSKLPLYLNVRILEAVREADPDCRIVVNGRLARYGSNNLGDYTSTGDRAAHFRPVEGSWESIPTTNESYGYSIVDSIRKPASHFVRLLASAVSRGGNILMNVGPMGNGRWDEKDIALTRQIGDWLKVNGASIYGAGSSGLPVQNWGVTTRRADTLFVHVFEASPGKEVTLGGMRSTLKKGWAVSDGAPVTFRRCGKDDYIIRIPEQGLDSLNTVLAFRIGRERAANPARLLDPSGDNILYTFDGQQVGKGWGYGDGKVHRNYLTNWRSTDQSVEWDLRLTTPAQYDVYLEYNTETPQDSGSVSVTVGPQVFEIAYTPCPEREGSRTLYAGSVSLEEGPVPCRLAGLQHNGRQFMRPISIILKKK